MLLWPGLGVVVVARGPRAMYGGQSNVDKLLWLADKAQGVELPAGDAVAAPALGQGHIYCK